MSNYLDKMVKCFNNSNLGVNLTTLLVDDEPWFIAKEVASALDYSDTAKAVTDHVYEEDQKMLSCSECKELFKGILNAETVESAENLKPDILSGLKEPLSISNRGMKLINESGLYTLIARSDKPEAKPFLRWVTSEVLPSIRKTGSYSVQAQTPSYTIEDKIKRAQAWIEEQKHILQLEEERAALEAKNTELTLILDRSELSLVISI